MAFELVLVRPEGPCEMVVTYCMKASVTQLEPEYRMQRQAHRKVLVREDAKVVLRGRPVGRFCGFLKDRSESYCEGKEW